MSVPEQEQQQQADVDIAIVGAGLVGIPLAYSLAKQGWSVALLDERGPARQPADSDRLAQRCTAINLGTQQWFARNDLWRVIESDACAIEQVAVSHKGYFGSTRLQAQEFNVKALGYVLNNDRLSA